MDFYQYFQEPMLETFLLIFDLFLHNHLKNLVNCHFLYHMSRRHPSVLNPPLFINALADDRGWISCQFTESGKYRFVIEDIYGNNDEIVVEFKRELPLVDWRYQLEDGTYAQYDFDLGSEKINIEKIDEQNYAILTSTYLRFGMLDGCVYEILTGDPKPNQNVTTKMVTLNNKVPFTMKVYYEAFPETYVIYTCVVDDSVPEITISYEKEYYHFPVFTIQPFLLCFL